MDSKSSLDKKILESGSLELTSEQKQAAIKKEEHYRKLYHTIYDLNQTKDFNHLAIELIQGYNKMLAIYENDPTRNKEDMNYIIKFAFRDFFLLIFINMKSVFDNNEFLKKLHREVYLSQNYVTLEQFRSLVEYCEQKIKNESK